MARDEFIIIAIVSIVALVGLVPLFAGGQAGAVSYYRVGGEFRDVTPSGVLEDQCDWVEAPGGGRMAVCEGVTYPTRGFYYGAPAEYRRTEGAIECKSLSDCMERMGIVQKGVQWRTEELLEPGKLYYYQTEGGWVEITTGE